MASSNRDQLVKPEFMSDQEFQWVKDATESLERIRGDARADAAAYQASPEGWAEGRNSRSGMPTLLLTTIGRKSGEKRATPLLYLHEGWRVIVIGSLAGYDNHPFWYLNLQANPNCWIQLDDIVMQGVARDATDAERETHWPRVKALFPAYDYFQTTTPRKFGLVFITPNGPA